MNTILISGAASGIGAATAKLFHRQGWRVGLLDLNPEPLAALAADLAGAKGGSGYPMAYNSCLTAMTDNRIKELQALSDCQEGDFN
ncbi:SDR family NAD(P)-dependent oxidoreductase, partial [Pseudomonas sp. CAN2814]|uniref:SDR family NAD(P)-dependent oxidoreductase n=1 Tax=Pseudomonas sp. CAN1 TaxID=3046726 RepID=UPI00264A2178